MIKTMNKRLILLVVCLTFSLLMQGQDWVYNFKEAKTKAQSQGKHIVLVFAGSDWCAPCIKLEKKIWESPKFKELAKDTFVMLKADFPRRKKNRLSKEQQAHNNRLAEKYNRAGNFPLVVVLDNSGNTKGKIGYKNISPQEYYNLLKSF